MKLTPVGSPNNRSSDLRVLAQGFPSDSLLKRFRQDSVHHYNPSGLVDQHNVRSRMTVAHANFEATLGIFLGAIDEEISQAGPEECVQASGGRASPLPASIQIERMAGSASFSSPRNAA